MMFVTLDTHSFHFSSPIFISRQVSMTVTEPLEQGKLGLTCSCSCVTCKHLESIKYTVAKGQDHANTAEIHVSSCYALVHCSPSAHPIWLLWHCGLALQADAPTWSVMQLHMPVKGFDRNPTTARGKYELTKTCFIISKFNKQVWAEKVLSSL